ncbi:hypothetical protein NMG60_11015883 [Bertholletia excelsa]
MGCGSSKLDDLPAVSLCRERCASLDEAIHLRYALAESHFAYMRSLRDVGLSLNRFFDLSLDYSTAESSSPVLNLPPQRKGDTNPTPHGFPSHKAAPAAIRHSHSNSASGSHLRLRSDSDSDGSSSESPLHPHSGNTSPLHSYAQINYDGGGFLNTGININYMKNKTTPSVSYEQRPMSPETGHMGESSSFYYPYPYGNQNLDPFSDYKNQGYGGGGINGFFGSSYAPQPMAPVAPAAAANLEASTSKQPPPPPSPPRSSAWDFLNPFDTLDKYYGPYTPGRDSKDVRDEEGIPDLEEEDFQQEVVKEVDGDQKFVDNGGSGKNYGIGLAGDRDVKANGSVSDSVYNTRQSVSRENEAVEVHMVDKKVVKNNEGASEDRGNAAAFRTGGDSEVVKELQVQFERASDSGNELAKMLEIGKFPYKKSAAYQVSSKMLHVMTPKLPAGSQNDELSSNLEIDGDLGARSESLSCTLHKLYLWEKKLYEEVKDEEKMRVLHEKKCRKLKHLDERGAEAYKVDATRTLVKDLSTKIRIALQVIDKISLNINKSRDEELWPQLNDFIQGLARMWKVMQECHHKQCEAIGQAKRLDAVASLKHSSYAHLEAMLHLGHELLNWTLRFSHWVGTQKGYVRALNNWLLKCLLYEPEETADGVVPFSPGRIGAPPIFVICNQWSQSLERISEMEVVNSMRDFAMSVLQLLEQDKMEMYQRMMVNKDMERTFKHLEREDLKIQIQAVDKMIVMMSEGNKGISESEQFVYQSDTSKTSNLQVSLQRTFEAIERFTENSMRTYEELLQCIEEDKQERLAQESESIQ